MPRVDLGKVLLATDFSPCSQVALPYAASIADRCGSRLLVVHVAQPRDKTGEEEAKQDAEEALRDFVAPLAGFPCGVLICRGDGWAELSGMIEAYQIDLIVIGTYGQSDLRKAGLGLTARQALRHASCPVLTVGPNAFPDPLNRPDFREVLYVTDLEFETPAAAYAALLASEFQAHLSLLHATEKQNGALSELLTERVYASVPGGAGLLRRPTAFVKYGSPVERILEAEHERGADLIVLAARRADQFSEAPAYLAWSGIERIVTQAHCPVLTVCS